MLRLQNYTFPLKHANNSPLFSAKRLRFVHFRPTHQKIPPLFTEQGDLYDPLDLNKEYTLTDVSRLPAAFASIKAVVDYITSWPESALYDWRNEFTIAASSCYQYVDRDPFYDICSYLT